MLAFDDRRSVARVFPTHYPSNPGLFDAGFEIFGLRDPTQVMVGGIEEGPASKAGLHWGDVLISGERSPRCWEDRIRTRTHVFGYTASADAPPNRPSRLGQNTRIPSRKNSGDCTTKRQAFCGRSPCPDLDERPGLALLSEITGDVPPFGMESPERTGRRCLSLRLEHVARFSSGPTSSAESSTAQPRPTARLESRPQLRAAKS